MKTRTNFANIVRLVLGLAVGIGFAAVYSPISSSKAAKPAATTATDGHVCYLVNVTVHDEGNGFGVMCDTAKNGIKVFNMNKPNLDRLLTVALAAKVTGSAVYVIFEKDVADGPYCNPSDCRRLVHIQISSASAY